MKEYDLHQIQASFKTGDLLVCAEADVDDWSAWQPVGVVVHPGDLPPGVVIELSGEAHCYSEELGLKPLAKFLPRTGTLPKAIAAVAQLTSSEKQALLDAVQRSSSPGSLLLTKPEKFMVIRTCPLDGNPRPCPVHRW